MKIIGVTGRSGSGKSWVANYYKTLGYPSIDGDAVSREVTRIGSECLQDLVVAFGPQILGENGQLIRAKLATIAFSSQELNDKLIKITHPYILKEVFSKVEEAKSLGAKLFFIDGAMIVGGIFEQHCDKIIAVKAPNKVSISRIILRDGISKIAANKRLSAQLSEEELCNAADFIIENNSSIDALRQKADKILEILLQQ